MRSGRTGFTPPEPLGVLLLPRRLEELALAPHLQSLLTIPRVIAIEPRRSRSLWRVGDIAASRQARRLRFPGEPRIVVLYHPGQYPFARALGARYQDAELWYLRTEGEAGSGELIELDELARQRAVVNNDITEPEALAEAERALRRRLRELGIITHRPFVPGARSDRG